jgi:hypothetical protein
MEHFAEQPWADFVRGVSAPQVGRDIKAHLAEGCLKCQTAHDAWNRIHRLATEESTYAAPANLVRLVKMEFGEKPVSKRPLAWTLANLVFDSFAQPLPAGVRSAAISAWQVVYEAEGLAVDLRFGRRAQSKAVHLVGQVFDKQAARAFHSNATIELRTENDQLVAVTAVNDMGEFHLEFEQKDHLWLTVTAAARKSMRIPLTNPK